MIIKRFHRSQKNNRSKFSITMDKTNNNNNIQVVIEDPIFSK